MGGSDSVERLRGKRTLLVGAGCGGTTTCWLQYLIQSAEQGGGRRGVNAVIVWLKEAFGRDRSRARCRGAQAAQINPAMLASSRRHFWHWHSGWDSIQVANIAPLP